MSSKTSTQEGNSRARSYRRLTERPLSDLKPNSIYIALKYRDTELPDNFHWSLYDHCNAEGGGTKYHITGSTGRWIAAHETIVGMTKESFLIGIIRVASFDQDQLEMIDVLARKEDLKLNEIEGITCRVWVGRMCERLKEQGIMAFESWSEVERESMDFGNEHRLSCEQGVQPRPMVDSEMCSFKN